MPLFGRSDGVLINNLSPVRRMIPYLLRGRNESVVYFEQTLDLTKTLPFIKAWNESHDRKLTLFHVVLAAVGRTLHARNGLNRFVSGGHIYQRNGVTLSFAAKKRFDDEAPLVTIKLPMLEREPLEETVARLYGSIGEGRGDKERGVDKEVRWILYMPGFLVAFFIGLFRLLDRWNLAPGAMLKTDPMYTSAFLANLGSVGIDRAWHHLYEWGTCSIFAALGVAGKSLVVGSDGKPEARDTVRLYYAYDERINDGFYCAASLDIVRRLVEDPSLFAADPASIERAPKPKTSAA